MNERLEQSTSDRAQGTNALPRAELLMKPISKESSDMIRVARVLCILFMMTTHAWPGSVRILAADVTPPLHLLYVIIVDSLGRAAVPLLSMVSGILFVHTFVRRSQAEIVAAKFQTLIVPMVLWSLPVIPLMFAAAAVKGEPLPRLDGALDWINLLFAITSSPANGPLHFLREIFVMSMYGIVILTVCRISHVAGALIAIGVVILEQIPGGFLLFRNQIATMYVFGVLLAYTGCAEWRPSWTLVLSFMGLLLTAHAFGWLNPRPEGHLAFRLSEHLPRVTMSLLMWRVAYEIVLRRGKLLDVCFRYEPHIFTIFCAHAILVFFVGGFATFLGLHEESDLYPLLLLLQVVMFFVVGTALSKLLEPLPWLRGKARRRKARFATH